MLSWDDSELEPIVVDEIYEIGGETLGPWRPTSFRLVPEVASVQTTTIEPLIFLHYSAQTPFILIPGVEEVQTPYIDDSQTPDVQYIFQGGRVLRQPPLAAARPLEGTFAPNDAQREDDEILRQLQSTQARISIWSLLASSNTHRDALIRALSQIRVETTTTPKGLIHTMMVSRATCIVFSDDDLPLKGLYHTRPLYISVSCSGHRVSYVLLDNGSALNACLLATTIVLSYAPSNFGPSTQTVRAYDNNKREVMGTLQIELLIGPTTFSALFQVLRIPTSFNLLLSRPWIYRAGAIPSSLYQKVKFIHDGQVITIQSIGDMFISSELVLQISHSDDDLFLIGFTFNEVQTLEMEDFCQDFLAMSFDQHGSTVVLDIMRSMSYLPSMGLGRCLHGPNEFMAIPNHNVPFGLGFIPTEANYRYMAQLRKERMRARLTHMSFDYPIRPYTMRLADYFMRASESQTHLDGIIGGLSTTQEAELYTSASALATPSSPNCVSLMTLCFPDEIDEHKTFAEVGDIMDGAVPHDEYIVDGAVPHNEYYDEMLAMSIGQLDGIAQPELASPFDLFGVSAIEIIEIAEEIQITPALDSLDDVITIDDLFDGHVGPVEGAPDLWTHIFLWMFYRYLSPTLKMFLIPHLWI
ncbi:hypothetical protein PVL29_024295 [Vitis rotundifolia]|uniref:Uncharacterized protein n=1 Tax=Vitis rotundifolia TaxID=103349 RepID=A0AA39DAM2_VITRO|nr:hypothetical protein PVL29_024295 [Vitis rotundifolia]